ncbi:hypothetical protein K438DRAFT_2001689 [Mycena galopus ATCC 62051]|nr:hypothetical protein K438DRAFT_2001689 [Mycena galopus ATCC 62051]
MPNAHDGLRDVVKELKGESTSLKEGVEGTQRGMEVLEAQVRQLKETVEAVGKAAAETAATPTAARSYAAAAAPTLTAAQAAMLARTARMKHQIMLDKADEATTHSLAALTELEIKEKANLALTIMEAKMGGAAFAGARKLPNGGVVLDCRSKATAQWVREEDHMKQFLSALGGTCVFRPRRRELLVELVAVETRVEEAGTWRLVERESVTTMQLLHHPAPSGSLRLRPDFLRPPSGSSDPTLLLSGRVIRTPARVRLTRCCVRPWSLTHALGVLRNEDLLSVSPSLTI